MPGDNVEEIKNRLDIKDVVGGYVKLQKAGANYKARCPFHNEKTPSFFVSPARQVWRCFGCGVGGDHFTFVEQIEGVDFSEALRILASQAGVELRRQDPRVRSEKSKSLEVCALAARYFEHTLASEKGKPIATYLKERGINKESIKNFRIGYAPSRGTSVPEFLRSRGYASADIEKAGLAFKSDRTGEYISRFRARIIFPITNHNGDVVGFGGRKLTDKLAQKMGLTVAKDSAKYINSPQTPIYDKSKTLYGLDRARLAVRKKDSCIVVEGYTDAILAHQAGHLNTVAASGTALTEQQLNIMGRFTKNLVTAFDMDVAGDTATKRGIDLAQAMGFDVRVVTLEHNTDPADIITKDPKIWETALKDARSVVAFYLESALSAYDVKTPEGKRAIGALVTPIIKNIPSRIEQAHWVQQLALKLAVAQEDVWEDVRSAPEREAVQLHATQPVVAKETVAPMRKELLAQHIAMHVIKNAALAKKVKVELEHITQEESPAFLLIGHLVGARKKTQPPPPLKELADQLALEADVRGQEEFTESTLAPTLALYKRAILSSELQALEHQLREEEADGSPGTSDKLLKKVHRKTEELHYLSKSLPNY